MKDRWNSAEHYEAYIGRWSRPVAFEFLDWLKTGGGLKWIDVGCGTGALTSAIVHSQSPNSVTGIDPSEEHIDFLRKTMTDPRAAFAVGEAANLPVDNGSADMVVSGLVLNFVPDAAAAMNEFKRVVKSGGMVAAYVWDYADRMEMLRYFWDAAAALFPDAKKLDEGIRFPICSRKALFNTFNNAGFEAIETTDIDVPTRFKDFDDYWNPFLSGIGPAPGYCMSLSEFNRNLLREKLYSLLPVKKDGSIDMISRAIAVKSLNR